MTAVVEDIRSKFDQLAPEDQMGYVLWLWREYHSNKIEGEDETARLVALILQALAADVYDAPSPSDLTNTPRP